MIELECPMCEAALMLAPAEDDGALPGVLHHGRPR